MDGLPSSHHCSVVRPKERRPDVHQQNPFMRGNTIIRSKTFSPGPQSQYICRVTSRNQHVRERTDLCLHLSFHFCCFLFLFFQINRSDSDSSTLSKKSPFVRNSSERRSMRMKKVDTEFVSVSCSYLIQGKTVPAVGISRSVLTKFGFEAQFSVTVCVFFILLGETKSLFAFF